MNRRLIIIISLVVLGSLGTLAFAQRRPYDQVMKDVGSTFASLKKNMDANSSDAASQDAAKLEALFTETGNFWTQFETKDAIDAATAASKMFAAIGVALKENNVQKAQTVYAGAGRTCKGCHDSHREQLPNKSYVIKP